jgi:hypothetical protein
MLTLIVPIDNTGRVPYNKNMDYLEIVDGVDREVSKLKALAALLDRSAENLTWNNGVADIIADSAETIGIL